MRRLLAISSVLSLIAGGAASRVFVAPAGAPFVQAPVLVTATSLAPALTAPSNFVGFSFDTQSDFLKGYFAPGNASLISLLALIGPSGDIRIGDYNDRTAPSQITAGLVNNFAAFVAALGPAWTVTWGLNSSAGAGAAVAEVALFESAFGSGKVIYQIGNEPDGVWSGNEAGYLGQWGSYYSALHAAYPAARFSGPDIANAYISGLGWIPDFTAAYGADVVEITQHYYSVDSSGTIASLLPKAVLGLQTRALQQIALASPLPARITESNTEEPGGIKNVSDRAVAAPWVVLEALILAQSGWAGIDVHGGPTGNFYSPFTLLGSSWGAAPMFSGLALARFVDGAGVLPTSVQGGGSAVWGQALKSPSGAIEFLVVNTDTANAWSVKLSAPGAPGSTEAILLAQGVNGSASDPATTLGGSKIGAGGAWTGAAVVQALGAPFNMPPASAALVTFQ